MNNTAKLALIIGGSVLAFLVLLSVLWGWISGWQGMGWGMMGGFGGGGLMGLGMIVFWGLLIWGIVALARGVTTSGHSDVTRQTEPALEILKRRYAGGEVTREEYEQKKKDILG
ncbi:MAG: SHOCT domain-containing protein [Dehalococcoidia bacterium]|nr:SHOCT domain-containing protein [Dehalococcoidia bacterium]